jgi:hypothetical protein
VSRGHWLALLPLLVLGAGCAWQEHNVTPKSWLERLRQNPIDGPHAVIELALIERPAGDSYINRELWDSVDELVVDLERRAALDDNGLRLGQLIGSPPHAFQSMLLSKRSCSNPHALMVPPGRTMPVYLGPMLAHSAYELVQGTSRKTIELDQARYCLEVTPVLTADGRTKLSFTPKVEHGESVLPFQPAPDESSWTLRIERAHHRYAEFGWEVTLSPNQYLIIGGRVDRDTSLGYEAFFQDEESGVQRLLVLRCRRGGPAATETELDGAPLALQATVAPTARAQKN